MEYEFDHWDMSLEASPTTRLGSRPTSPARDEPSPTPSPLAVRPEHLEMALQEPDPFSLIPPPTLLPTNNTAARGGPGPQPEIEPLTNSFDAITVSDDNPPANTSIIPNQASPDTANPDTPHPVITSTIDNDPAQPAVTPRHPDRRSWPQYTNTRCPLWALSPNLDAGVLTRLRHLQETIPITTTTHACSSTNTTHGGGGDDNDNDNGEGRGFALRALTSVAGGTGTTIITTDSRHPSSTDPRQGNHHDPYQHRDVPRTATAPPPAFGLPAIPLSLSAPDHVPALFALDDLDQQLEQAWTAEGG